MAKNEDEQWKSVPQDEPDKSTGDPLTGPLKIPSGKQTEAPLKVQGDPLSPTKKKKTK